MAENPFTIEYATDFWFLGEFEHSVDDKGRVIMPQDFRTPLGKEFVATRGPDQCVWIMPKAVWSPFEERLKRYVLHPQGGFLQRMLFGKSDVSLDPQNRCGIPKHLRDWAKITQNEFAVIMGRGPKIEIWTKSIWDEFSQRFTTENFYQAASEMGLSELTIG